MFVSGPPLCRASVEGLTGLGVLLCLWLRLVGGGQAPRGVGIRAHVPRVSPPGGHTAHTPPATHVVLCVCPGKPGTHTEPSGYWGQPTEAPSAHKVPDPGRKAGSPCESLCLLEPSGQAVMEVQLYHLGTIPSQVPGASQGQPCSQAPGKLSAGVSHPVHH